MKLFCFVLAAVAVSVGAADTIFVEIKTKNTESFPAAAMDQFGSLLPSLITGLLPDDLKAFSIYFTEIPIVSSVDPATKVGTIKAYLPKVPISLKAAVEPQLNTFINSASFKDQISAILPAFLQCGACEYDSAGIGVDSPTNPVSPPAPTTGEIIGVKMLLKGATAVVPTALLDAAKAALPGLLDTEFANLVPPLPSSTLAVIKQIVQSLDVKQQLQTTDPTGLWIKVIFTGVDQSVAALYEPLIKQYVIDNDAVKAFLKSPTVSGLFNCAQGCSIDEITLIDDSVPIKAATKNPTMKPTPLPTKMPTKKPTAAPSASPTVPPTKDEDQNASSQGAQITVAFFVAMALIWA